MAIFVKICGDEKDVEILPGGGGGGVLPYISHIGMCRPHRVGFYAVLVESENGYRFCRFWSGIGYVSEGTRECTNVFIVSIPNG